MKTWCCEYCPYAVPLVGLPPGDDVPAHVSDQYIESVILVGQHRFQHLLSAVLAETDEEIAKLCFEDGELDAEGAVEEAQRIVTRRYETR